LITRMCIKRIFWFQPTTLNVDNHNKKTIPSFKKKNKIKKIWVTVRHSGSELSQILIVYIVQPQNISNMSVNMILVLEKVTFSL